MINKTWQIPVTDESIPFSYATDCCNIAAHGYREQEIFFSGTANLYRTGENGAAEIEYADVPYTNRMMIRAPKCKEDFSGHVVIEIVNATGRFDIERMWIISREYFMRHGIIFIGLTSKPDVFDALTMYDAQRYAPLNWPNPRPQEQWLDPTTMPGRLTFVRQDQECGLFWDMLTDLPDLLRSDSEQNPLREYAVKNITLTGWSQSSCYEMRYINDFAYRNARKAPVYDGYFLAGCVFHHAVPLNQYEYPAAAHCTSYVRHMEQPMYLVQTESENGSYGTMSVPREDCDEPGRLCRVWEMAGSTHDNKRGLVDYYAHDKEIPARGYPPQYMGQHNHPNDFPYEFTMNAAWDHLFRWIETGIAPRVAPRFSMNAKGTQVVDALGNAVGGVRSAFVDLPTRRYIPWSDELRNGKISRSTLFGHEELFSAAFVREMYGSLANYEAKVREATERHILNGFVLAEEAEDLIAETLRLAGEVGLE